MAAISTVVIAGAALAGAAVSASNQREARNEARRAARNQERARQEQRASNAARAAQERRQQIREERVRRARILQSAENTGTSGSSGEIGALGSLATQLGSNIGFNLGEQQRGENISIFSQAAANANFNAFQAQSRGQQTAGLINTAGSIFSNVNFGSSGDVFGGTADYLYGTGGIGD